MKTDTEIFLSRDRPLFQVQPIPRAAYLQGDREMVCIDDIGAADSEFDWDSLAGVMRKTATRDTRRPGRYAATQRKASKEPV